MRSQVRFTLAAALLLGACSDRPEPLEPLTSVSPQFAEGESDRGLVFTATNAAAGNAVVAFQRAPDGSLAPLGTFATGGNGTGAGLGNQGGVMLARGHRYLLVVNAGSNSISSFRVGRLTGLTLLDVEPSGGVMPISIAVFGGLVYVLNAGGDGNITGFRLSTTGELTPIANSTRPLSQAGGTGPAQVGFSPDGKVIVVTEKMTNRIDTYVLGPDDTPGAPIIHTSAGETPFGFGIDAARHLIVSEAHGGAVGASTLSSYQISAAGALAVISPTVPNGQTAACWIVITEDGSYTYTTNTGSNNISSYTIAGSGALALLAGVAAASDAGPIDAALSRNGPVVYLYVLNSGAGTITVFRVNGDGSLTALPGDAAGLPLSSNGLAAI